MIPDEVIEAAKASNVKYDILASITIAQWALESNFGKDMPPYSNNPFGIKARDGAPSVIVETHEEQNGQVVVLHAAFAKFDSIADAFVYHANLLRYAKPYQSIQKYRHNYKDFANHLTGIYATDHLYGQKLITIIKEYRLTQYDKSQVKSTIPTIAAVSTIATATATTIATQAPKTITSPLPSTIHIANALSPHIQALKLDTSAALAALVGFFIGCCVILLYFAIEDYRRVNKPVSTQTLEELEMTISTAGQTLATAVAALKVKADNADDLQNQLNVAKEQIIMLTQTQTDDDTAIAQAAGVTLNADGSLAVSQ